MNNKFSKEKYQIFYRIMKNILIQEKCLILPVTARLNKKKLFRFFKA